MIDSFGRKISYLRLSVTDRCNFRCLYCMGDDPDLLSHSEILSVEELVRLSRCFIRLGITKLRITGGEPLVRQGVLTLIDELGQDLRLGRLSELTLTSNGMLLAKAAERMYAAGMRRVNVSLDALDPDLFSRITRGGQVERVKDGIAAAAAAGLKVRINTVLLRGLNDREIDPLIAWAGSCGHDLALIEAMPIGDFPTLGEECFLSSDAIRRSLSERWTLIPSTHVSGGPARYFSVAETGGRLGFISALSHRFCSSCNRVRMTCTGTVICCLGQDEGVDLRELLREGADDSRLEEAIRGVVAKKPQRHGFALGASDAALSAERRNRMNRTGG